MAALHQREIPSGENLPLEKARAYFHANGERSAR